MFSISQTDMNTYPGRGLSLSQLVFALNEELKRVAYSPMHVERLLWAHRGTAYAD
jgi:hypothetical protein